MSIIRFLGHALAHGIAGEIDKAQLRKIEKRKNTICCADCEIVVTPDSRACHSCGSQKFCSEYDLQAKKEQAKELAKLEAECSLGIKMQDQLIASHEKQRERDYKARKKALLSGLVCPSCNLLYESTHKFCPACATKTVELETEAIEAFLMEEFPERFTKER